jgi:hypothetical protein
MVTISCVMMILLLQTETETVRLLRFCVVAGWMQAEGIFHHC